jgi:hypothetical protein
VDFFAALNILVYGLLFLTVYSVVMWHDPQATLKIVRAAAHSADAAKVMPNTQPSGYYLNSSQLMHRVDAGLNSLFDLFYRAASFLQHRFRWLPGSALASLGAHRRL